MKNNGIYKNEGGKTKLKTKTFLRSGQKLSTVQKVLNGEIKTHVVGQSVLDEAKMHLINKGFSIDTILQKYIDIVNKDKVTYRGSDVVAVLDRLSNILGLEVKPAEQTTEDLTRRLQNAPIQDIQVYLVKITEDANRYIEGLKDIEEADIIG